MAQRTSIVRRKRPAQFTVLMVLLVSLALPTFVSADTTAVTGKRVLFISSYSPAFPTFFLQIDGLKSQIDAHKQVLDIEFMDAKRFDTPENRQNFYNSLKYKLSNLPPYDIVIVSDDNGLNFVMEKKAELFPQIPVVFLGINNRENALKYSRDPLVTGVIEAASLGDTVAMAYALNPEARRVVALVDGTPSGQGDLAAYYHLQPQFPNLKLTELSLADMSFEAFGEALSGLDDSNLVLLLSAYQDRNGTVMTFYDSLDLILAHLNQPLYHPYYHGIGDGVLGGRVISHYEQGRQAGMMVMRILSGEPADRIPVLYDSPNPYLVDYKVLERFRLGPGRLPEGTEFINREENLLVKYLVPIVAILAGIVLQTLVILALVMSNRTCRKAEQELNNALEALRISNRRFDLAASASGIGVWEWDIRENQLHWDDRMYEMYGTDRNDFHADYEAWLERVHPEDRDDVHDQITKALAEESDFDMSFRILRADGTTRTVKSYSLKTRDPFGEPIRMTGMNFDITEQQKHQEDLERSKAAAEAADRAKSNFLAVMSHEIRTPMNGFIGMLELLAMTSHTQEQAEYLDVAHKSAEALLSVVNDVLDYSKIEAGRMELSRHPYSLQRVMEDTMSLFKAAAIMKGLQLSLTIAPAVPEICLGDPLRVRQILSNLIGNAVKFTEAGTVSAVLEARPVEDGRVEVTCTIADTGIGIAAEDLQSVFDRFNQVDNSYTRQFGGSGLGLAISRRLAEMMNGWIEVESTKGQGSAFRFIWTPETGVPEPRTLLQATAEPNAGALDQVRILLVDDDPISRFMMEKLAEKKGWSLTTVSGGVEALEILKAGTFGLVLLDVQMPEMDGYETARQIRVQRGLEERPIRIVALTAAASEESRNRCLEAGMDGFLTKPLGISALESTLHGMLKSAETDR